MMNAVIQNHEPQWAVINPQATVLPNIQKILEPIVRRTHQAREWSHPGFSILKLTTLLVYCYSQSNVRSSEIVRRMECDPTLIQFCSGTPLSPATIQSFRRAHHDLIVECLATALNDSPTDLLQEQGGEFVALFDWITSGGADSRDYWLSIAEERVSSAILLDSISNER